MFRRQTSESTMTPELSKDDLRRTASWIRDELDPRIARDGPDVMQPDDVLTLHELFVKLRQANLPISWLRYSRIHMAVLEISGRATRWPKRLVEECDRIIDLWEKKYGRLTTVRPKLFGPDGRLYGICTGKELTRDALLKYWTSKDSKIMDPNRALVHGALGFTPGDWWINGMFAFHAGIIDINSTDGGIVANRKGAYAILMKDSDEIYTETPNHFKYRCRAGDPGRFRMTTADFRSRYPIRVLRSHDLSSLWAPRSGIRYDGLHKVSGWTIKPVNPAENDGYDVVWEIALDRDISQNGKESSGEALKHPLAEEVDDYMEYKRVRKEVRDGVKQDIMNIVPATPNPQEEPGDVLDRALAPTHRPSVAEPEAFLGVPGLREPIIPSPHLPPLPKRKSVVAFAQPQVPTIPPSQPAADGNGEAGAQRTRTFISPALRRSLGTVVEPKYKGIAKKSKTESQVQQTGPPLEDDRRSSKEISKRLLVKSISRIFDGHRDDDIPESPLGGKHGDEEPSSFPFDMTDSNRSSPSSIPEKKGWRLDDSIWELDSQKGSHDMPTIKPGFRMRRDRAVYEALERQEVADAEMLLAALEKVWDDCEDPEYPDMVIEDTDGHHDHHVNSDDYLFRIPQGGIDIQKYLEQLARENPPTARSSVDPSRGSYTPVMGDVLREHANRRNGQDPIDDMVRGFCNRRSSTMVRVSDLFNRQVERLHIDLDTEEAARGSKNGFQIPDTGPSKMSNIPEVESTRQGDSSVEVTDTESA